MKSFFSKKAVHIPVNGIVTKANTVDGFRWKQNSYLWKVQTNLLKAKRPEKILSDFIANKIFMQNISAALVKCEFRFVVVWPAIVHASEIYFDFSTRVESVFSGQFPWKHTASVYLMTTKKCSSLSEQWLRGQLSICHHVLPRFVANMDVFHFFPGATRKTQARVSEMARNQFSTLIQNRWFRSS